MDAFLLQGSPIHERGRRSNRIYEIAVAIHMLADRENKNIVTIQGINVLKHSYPLFVHKLSVASTTERDTKIDSAQR